MSSTLANPNYEPELPHSGAGSAPPTGSQRLPAARATRPSSEAPAWSPDLAQVQDFLQLLARAVRQLHTYPLASPLCVDAIAACRQTLVALQTRDRIVARLTPHELVVDDTSLGAGFEIEGHAYEKLRPTADYKEGIAAFSDKRKPNFAGA